MKIELNALLKPLEEKHRNSLIWFYENKGRVVPWPGRLSNETLVASKAKGIYKPAWSKYALSVRQSLNGPYPDLEPVKDTDGGWNWLYFQENLDPGKRDLEYTNVGLMKCIEHKVPVGVLREVAKSPVHRYLIMGLALVTGWEEGYFVLQGVTESSIDLADGPKHLLEVLDSIETGKALSNGTFEPESIIDERRKVQSSIIQRRGQPAFRRKLIEIYEGKCAISDCNTVEALEACHIVPYMGPETNHPTNGLLLRSDIHTLFDIGLMSIESESMTVLVAEQLRGTPYFEFSGNAITLPKDSDNIPSKKALNYHRKWAGI